MSEKQSSTSQLKPVLGFWDLMGTAIGQIIGAGIMTLVGAAIALTGRSVPLAFLVAFLITVSTAIPQIFIASTVRCRGGNYSMIGFLAGKQFAGAYSIIYIFSNISLSMYALSFSSYLCALFNVTDATMIKIVALIILTAFYVLNIMGIDKFAAVQNVIVACLIIALAMFSIFGITKVDFSTYFDEATWMTGGMMGLFQAGGLLSFATGGATIVVGLSAESKNPTKDIPIVIIASTLFVAVIYAFMAFVAAGVLPVEQVAGQNLTVVAKEILPYGLYVFFIIAGAGFALISTLNSQLASAPKPTMQACDDGWLPQGVAKLSKWNTPIVILTILYIIAAVCILTGLSVSILGNMCLIASGVLGLMINFSLYRLPQRAPKAWASSKFHVSDGVLKLFTAIGCIGSCVSIYLNATQLDTYLIVINVVVIAVSLIFGFVRAPHVNMQQSVERICEDGSLSSDL